MRPNSIRLPRNVLFADEASKPGFDFSDEVSKPDLDALRVAKARQDGSHQKLDQWIAAAIAELSETAAR
jgi:hypothetical protein